MESTLSIPGLHYRDHFVTDSEAEALRVAINAAPWLGDLKRRVQHYGYKYDYKARKIDHSMHLGPLPAWVSFLAERLVTEGIFPQKPDQLIINEYQPGQGIAPHVDCEPCFTGTIASVSLLSPIVMNFTKESEKVPVVLRPRSIVVLQGSCRYDWKHAIAARKSDVIGGVKVERRRRISLTFRNVILDS